MEYFPTNIMLLLAFSLALVLESLRFQLVGALNLNLPRAGAWRFAYYVSYMTTCVILAAVTALLSTFVLDRIWSFAISQPSPWSAYVGGFFLVFLAGVIAILLYVALGRIKRTHEMVAPLLFLTLIALGSFVWKPTRFVVGGTFFVLLSSVAGRLLRFSGWDDLTYWLARGEKTTTPAGPAEDRIRIALHIHAEGVLARRGGTIELIGEEIAEPGEGRAQKLAQTLLDRSRLTEITAALEDLNKRQDLVKLIPPIIAQNVGKLGALRETLSQRQGRAEEKEKTLEDEVRNLLDQRIGAKIRSLLYWNYDLPGDGVSLSISRAPQVEMKPLISFREYLGLFLSVWQRRS